MFMGIPFIVQAAQATKNSAEKQTLLDDAAGQILAFDQQLFDSLDHLYQHAQYSSHKAKLPYW